MLLPRFQMMPWTAQEISLLIGLWPNASAAQISKQLNRSRGSVCGKAMRLRRHDLLPADVEKHSEGESGGADAAGFRQGNRNTDHNGKADAPGGCDRAARNAALLVGRTG